MRFTENGNDVLPKTKIGRDYKVYYRLKDGIYEYNVSESIREYTRESLKYTPSNLIYFDKDDINTGMLGSFKTLNGKRHLHRNKECININKKFLYKLK